MITSNEFVKQSLALHLFFARIMKEHSFFLQVSFTPKDHNFTSQADSLRRAFDALLTDAVRLSNGVVNPGILQSGEVITQFTLKAEEATSFYTGIQLPTEITRAQANLSGGAMTTVNPVLERTVAQLNDNAIRLLDMLIQFKTTVLSDVNSCKMFTMNYPLLIDHILREAKFYQMMVRRLQSRQDMSLEKEAYEQEAFWNNIMGEHAEFIRGLLDPTEKDLMAKANNFANEFERLERESKQAMERTIPLKKITDESLVATTQIRDFKSAGTQGILSCKIKSIIIPLLADHTLREANHYLRLLDMFGKGTSTFQKSFS